MGTGSANPRASWDPQGLLDPPALRGPLASMDLRGPLDPPALSDPLDRPVPLDRWALPAPSAPLAPLALRERPAPRDLLDPRVLKVPRVLKGPLGLLDRLDPRGPQVLKDPPASS